MIRHDSVRDGVCIVVMFEVSPVATGTGIQSTGCSLSTCSVCRVTANMCLIAFGVLVCSYGELNLVVKGLILQLSALAFEVCPNDPPRNQGLAPRAGRV